MKKCNIYHCNLDGCSQRRAEGGGVCADVFNSVKVEFMSKLNVSVKSQSSDLEH